MSPKISLNKLPPTAILFIPILFLLFSSSFGAEIELIIDFPPQGAYLDYSTPFAPIAGYAFIPGSHNLTYQIIIALDTSSSTAIPSGKDLDKDGVMGQVPYLYQVSKGLIGEGNTDPDDSIFAAELLATRRLLRLLDPHITEVGLVSFSGDYSGGGGHSNITTPDAYLEHPLTRRYADIFRALDSIRDQGPAGGTNIAAGIRQGIETLALAGSDSSKKIILLLTDGFPSFPVGSANIADPEDKILAISAAHLAKLAGITINTYALGPEALSSPFTLQEIARVTGGTFFALSDPAEITTQLEKVKFVSLKDIEIENITLTKLSQELVITPEGFFFALVPVTEGLNKIRVLASAADGSSAEQIISLYWLGAESRDQVRLNLSLKEDRIADLKLTLAREKERLMRYKREKLQLELQIGP
jgi:hypothetical protein